jgi:hypothetical protein
MTTYIGMSGPATELGIKLMDVLYVPRVRQWFSILRSEADVSRAADLGHPEGTLLSYLIWQAKPSTHHMYAQDQLFHTYGQKAFIDNQMS